MSSRVPTVCQIAWLSVVPQLAVMGLIMGLLSIAGTQHAIVLGALIYLMLSATLRLCVPRAHRRGILLLKGQAYASAIPEFERSYDFFTQHRWVDEWRFLALLSSSRISYRELALLNLAFCHGQTGHGSQAKEYYQRALAEFPDSEMARTALRLVESVEKAAEAASVVGERYRGQPPMAGAASR